MQRNNRKEQDAALLGMQEISGLDIKPNGRKFVYIDSNLFFNKLIY
jgi:hypothetical protein